MGSVWFFVGFWLVFSFFFVNVLCVDMFICMVVLDMLCALGPYGFLWSCVIRCDGFGFCVVGGFFGL